MHTHWFVLALFVSASLGCGSATKKEPPVQNRAAAESPKEPTPEIEAVQADVRKLQNAVYGDGGAETVIELTHPLVIDEMGGAENATAELEKAMSAMQSAGIVIESTTFPADPTFFSSATHDFVFVPTLTIFAMNGQRIENLSFLLGAKRGGTSKWTYIDGSEVNGRNIESWFPDFPPGQTYPNTYKKQL